MEALIQLTIDCLHQPTTSGNDYVPFFTRVFSVFHNDSHHMDYTLKIHEDTAVAVMMTAMQYIALYSKIEKCVKYVFLALSFGNHHDLWFEALGK